MTRFAVIGAGPAGCRIAALLATSGKNVTIFDPRAPWEKPCGGGLTHKVLADYPEIPLSKLNARVHHRMEIVFPRGPRSILTLDKPIATVSRQSLASWLLEKARVAGAEFVPEKALRVERDGEGFLVFNDAGPIRYSYLIGADGWNSVVREAFSSPFARADLCLAYGVLLPIEVELPIIIRFFEGFMGYAWIFPRRGAISAGIALEKGGLKRDDLVKRLKSFVGEEFQRAGLSLPELGRPYAWLLPSLNASSFSGQKVEGTGWALAGDASGSADPLTGEGIYYALKTADLLADSLLNGAPGSYQAAWQEMAEKSVAKIAKKRDDFYKPFTMRVVSLLTAYSPPARDLVRDIIAGAQPYHTLRARVNREWPRYVGTGIIGLLIGKKAL